LSGSSWSSPLEHRPTDGGTTSAVATGFRRSELAAIDSADLTFTPDGQVVDLRRSKTDQEAAGHKVGIPFGTDDATCPVRAGSRNLASLTELPFVRSAITARSPAAASTWLRRLDFETRRQSCWS
jgi:hypothetical protein